MILIDEAIHFFIEKLTSHFKFDKFKNREILNLVILPFALLLRMRDLPMKKFSLRLEDIFSRHKCSLFGYADLTRLVPSSLGSYDQAISFGIALDPQIMNGVKDGPTHSYAALYSCVNRKLDSLSGQIAATIKAAGWRARAIPASICSDPENLKGDFPHKTAATLAGLGWIGKNAQLVTKSIGPWLRLSTVFTDLPLPLGKPVKKSYCGKCDLCVTACPAKVLKNALWTPGLARHEIIDVQACDRYKKEHFIAFNQGHNCGICTAVCPVGLQNAKSSQKS